MAVELGQVTASGTRSSHAYLAGGGEMGALMRSHDWSKTPLGPIEAWPQSLRTAARIILNSRYPMFVWWGEALTNLYNDGYIPMLGQRHPEALGRPAAEVWADVWSVVGPQTELVLKEGQSTWNEQLLLVMERYGYPEETYFTFSYSPVGDDAGGTGGVFCAVTEETGRVLGERRLKTLRDLAAATTSVRDAGDACRLAAEALRRNPHDVPFALLYLLDENGHGAHLAGAAGVEAGAPGAPAQIDTRDSDLWSLQQVRKSQKSFLVEDLTARFGPMPGGPWPDPSPAAVVLPLVQAAQEHLAGFLVAGISPRRPFDEEYRGFFDLLAGQVGTAIANARAHEAERKRAEALAELDRAKTAFFSNVSHEFRTPLTLMLGPLEDTLAAADGSLALGDRERLSVAHRNSLRLLKLVNTLLDFSRIEAGRVQASYEPTDLARFTADLASVFRSAVERAGMRLTIDCPPVPEPVYVDRDMWEKIVLNLLSNAFKFTFEGEISVTLKAEGRTVELAVRDTGIGIPPEELPRLFERFHRVQGAQGRTYEGTGIGLALVQELVKLHGGAIRVESAVGEGTTFVVAVPLGAAHLPADRLSAARTLARTALAAHVYGEEALRWLSPFRDQLPRDEGRAMREENGPGLSSSLPSSLGAERPRVLLADDNADMREYLCHLLRTQYDVEAVADRSAALMAARARRPDLVLADVMMPGLDGFGLLRELRADPAAGEVPIILLSARAGEEARVEGMHAGADDYLIKPFSARELLARVEAHLKLARQRREATAALREREAWQAGQKQALQAALNDAPLSTSLGVLVHTAVEQLGEETRAAFYLADPAGKVLHQVVGMPAEYAAAVDGFRIGPESLACGLATHLGLPVLTSDVTKEPRWAPWLWLAERFDYRGCWSFPIHTTAGKLVGTLAIYSRQPREATARELELASLLTQTASIIIARHQEAEVRRQAEEALKEADQRKDEFLAMLAHELRNPLAPILNAVHIQGMLNPADPRLPQQREMIKRQVEQMKHLLDDLLDVSRIIRNKIELRPERLELAAVLGEAVETSRPLIEECRHQLTVTLPPETVWLKADRTRMAEVFTNLLNNAAKYTHPGGRISLAAELNGGHVLVRVRDTGIGMAEEVLAHVFDLFSQAERSLDRSQGGLGIGLTIVRRLVEMHGGEVWAHSAGPGRGSEFVVRLPVQAVEHEANGQSREGTTGRTASAPKRRILVVDDNADAAESLAQILELDGHEVFCVLDGREVMAAARAHQPELILLDIGLPGRNGYEVAKELRAAPDLKQPVLVAISGYGQEQDRQRSQEVGFQHHLVKPVDFTTLQALLESLEPSAESGLPRRRR